MSPAESNNVQQTQLEKLLAEFCRTPMGKQKLVEAFADAHARQNALAADYAKAALFDPSKAPVACATVGIVQFLEDTLSYLSRI